MDLLRSIVIAGFALFAFRGGAQETFGERLGWAADQVVVVLHCNGGGMMQATGRGVMNALTKGLGSSYSVMMPCPWVPGFLKSRSPDSLDIGMEVTLTSAYDLYRWGPLAGKSVVPGLVDSDGCFWKTTQQVAAKATPDEVEREIRAQLDRATNLNLKIQHFTSHEWAVFAKPEFFDRYFKVAAEMEIPIVMAGGHMTYLTEDRSPLVPLMKAKAVEVWNAGLPVVDDIVLQVESWETGQKRAKIEAMLHSLKPGVTHIVFKPAIPTDDLRMVVPNYSSHQQDNVVLTDFGIRRLIENRKIVVTDWVELKKRRKKAAAIEK